MQDFSNNRHVSTVVRLVFETRGFKFSSSQTKRFQKSVYTAFLVWRSAFKGIEHSYEFGAKLSGSHRCVSYGQSI